MSKGQARKNMCPRLVFMEQVREVMRYHHYAIRTEEAYVNWILKFIRFNATRRYPKKMGKPEIERSLTQILHLTDLYC